MATLKTMDSPEKTPLELPKNGRAKAPVEAPEEVSAPLVKGVPKIGNVNAGSNWEYIDSIQDGEWKQLTCYVYRTAPVVDRQAAGKEISIDKLGEHFDMKEILKRHGSGRYKFILSYAPPNGGQWIRVRQFYETILDLDKPPRVPLGEWIENPANKDWEWAKPQLEADAQQRTLRAAESIGAAPAGGGQSKTEEFGQMLTLIEKFRGSGDSGNQALLLELMKQNDPSKMMDMYEKIASKTAPAPKEDSAVTVMLMQFLIKQLEAKTEAAAPVDPIESTTKLVNGVKGLMEGLGVNQNPGAPAKMDTTALVVQGVGDVLGKAIEQLGNYAPQILSVMQHSKDRDLQIAQVNAAKGMNPSRPWEFQGTAANPAVQPPPITAPAPTPHPENAPMTPMVFFSTNKALLDEMFPHFRDWFQNEDGYYVADWIIDRKGRDTYNAVRKDATVSMLMQITGAVPELNAIFQPKPDAELFFTELLCDPDARPPEEDEAEPAGEAS